MAKNRIFAEGRYLTLAIAAATSGAPVIKGQITGVAQSDTDAAGNTVVDTEGVYDLSVKGEDAAGANTAVAIGDIIYYDAAAAVKLNKDATNGVKFGVALEAIASGGTDTIRVKLGKF